ncbi:hypothetical protein DVR11_25985 [Paracoccus versutus]|nr:hypothetical protein DVR11_25985 [Paracoccus versutus]
MRDRETPRWEVIASEVFLVPSRGTGAELDVYFQGKLSGRGGDRRMWIQSVGRESLLDMVSDGFCVALLLSSAAQRRREGVGSIPPGGTPGAGQVQRGMLSTPREPGRTAAP